MRATKAKAGQRPCYSLYEMYNMYPNCQRTKVQYSSYCSLARQATWLDIPKTELCSTSMNIFAFDQHRVIMCLCYSFRNSLTRNLLMARSEQCMNHYVVHDKGLHYGD